MNSRFPGYLCSVLLLACCGGCASTRIPEDLFDDQADVVAPDPSFQSGMEFLTATNGAPAGLWRDADDWVLLGVKATRHGRTDVWFVRISSYSHPSESTRFKSFVMPITVGPVPAKSMLMAPVGRVCVEIFDQHGVSVYASIAQVPADMPCASLLELCKELAADRPVEGAGNLATAHPEALATLVVTLKAIGETKAFKTIREIAKSDMVEMPGVLSLLMAGFRLNAEVGLKQLPSPPATRLGPFNTACEEALLQLRIAGQPMINGRLICRSPDPPFHLTGGMLLLETVHPTKPHNRMMFCVLASRHN